MNKFDITNVDNLSINTLLNMNKKLIKGLGKRVENDNAVNVEQLNEMESTIGNYVKKEITKADTSLKNYFNHQLNNTIAEHGYPNSLICVFYLDNNQFANGAKISKLPDKKSFFPSYDANQKTVSRQPTADDDLNFSYLNFREKQCLTVNYNLNGKNNLHVFIVFRILEVLDGKIIGIFGNDNSSSVLTATDRFIDITHDGTNRQLRIGYGSGHEYITGFPSKASPVTLNFSVLSVHYNSVQVNDSLVYCNGKYVANFMEKSNTGGEDTFSIGSISSKPSSYNSLKQIAYFSLYHDRFNVKDIKTMHKYLCERYNITHDTITIP